MIRVVLVDDSAVVRRLFKKAMAFAPDVNVVAEAPDPYAARDLIVALKPDVLILDVEMPKMDGITFLHKLSQHYPLPVIVCSSLTEAGGALALDAFDAGAVDVIFKPQGPRALSELGAELVQAVRAAAVARPGRARTPRHQVSLSGRSDIEVVAVGASTGGTVAVESIVGRLPANTPPVVIVQHMPAYVTKAFAARLDNLSTLTVEEARTGRVLEPGVVLIAPGDRHLELERAGLKLRAVLHDEERVNGHRPAVDVLFRSVAKIAGKNAIGALLTGMGKDGAAGLFEMRAAGAHTLAQDEASSVVFGMPRAAIECGAAAEIVALGDIPQRLMRAIELRSPRALSRIS
ncbi:MAG TPA: chemotaxis response regulator protein-glutamate methylesterase [Polyangiaceae bacterium]|nr:chemotaxis response regulator protein-glutamate methylesterase [Polyangiaceae bacterium]